jgi:hypothetical protein
MIIIHCPKYSGVSKPVPTLQPGIQLQGITTNNGYTVVDSDQSSPELCSSPSFVEQEAANILGMIFDDQLCGIAGVGDLYTIGFDSVYVLGMECFFQAQENKER